MSLRTQVARCKAPRVDLVRGRLHDQELAFEVRVSKTERICRRKRRVRVASGLWLLELPQNAHVAVEQAQVLKRERES